MFLKPETNDIVAKAARLLGGKDPMFEAFIETYSTLSPSDRKVLMDFGINLVKSFHQKISNWFPLCPAFCLCPEMLD